MGRGGAWSIYAFYPAILKLPSGSLILLIVTFLFILGYLAAQLPFTKIVMKNGTWGDRFILPLVLIASIVLFVAPVIHIIQIAPH